MNFELCSPNTTYDAMNLELETNQFNQQSISTRLARVQSLLPCKHVSVKDRRLG